MRTATSTFAATRPMRSGESARGARKPCSPGIAGPSGWAARRTWLSAARISTNSTWPISPARRSRGRGSAGADSPSPIKRIFTMRRLKDRIAIVTGASHGIGRAIAQIYAEEGAAVFMGSLEPEAGEAAAAEFRSAGGDAVFVPCDVAQPGDVNRLVQTAAARNGRIDILCNNAAYL